MSKCRCHKKNTGNVFPTYVQDSSMGFDTQTQKVCIMYYHFFDIEHIWLGGFFLSQQLFRSSQICLINKDNVCYESFFPKRKHYYDDNIPTNTQTPCTLHLKCPKEDTHTNKTWYIIKLINKNSAHKKIFSYITRLSIYMITQYCDLNWNISPFSAALGTI